MCGGGGKGAGLGALLGGLTLGPAGAAAGAGLGAAAGGGVGDVLTGPNVPDPIPPPTRADPSVTAAAKRLRTAERLRRGRSASIIADPEETLGAPPVSRPGATASQLG